MSDIAKLGFSVDTQPLKKGEQALDSFAATGEKTERRSTKSSDKIVDNYSDIEKSLGKTATEAIKANQSFDKVSSSLERQIIKIKQGENGLRQYDIAQKLGLKSVEQIPRSIQKQIDSLIDLEKAQKRAVDQTRMLNKSIGVTATQSTKAEKSIRRSAAEQRKAEKELAKFSRSTGQAGIQIQQFIGQIQGGQSFMVAFSQQSADLGFVLGAPLLGAIAGITTSLIGIFLPALFDTTSAMQDLDKAIGEVNKTATETDGVIAFTKEITALAAESEKSARLLILAAEQSARDAGKAAAKGIGEEFNDAFDVTVFQRSFNALKSIAGTASGTGFSISKEYEELGEQFGLTGKEAREAGVSVLVSLREMENAVSANLPDAGEKIIAFQEELSDLAETAAGDKKTKLLSFVNSISEYISKAKTASEIAALFDKTLNETDLELPSDKTKKLSDSIDGVSDSLNAQIIALRDGEEAALNWSIAQRLGLKNGEELPESIKNQIEELKNLRNQQEDDLEFSRMVMSETKEFDDQQKKEKAKSVKDFENLSKQVEGFGGAWTKTGSVIVDAFGDISDAMSDYMSQLSDIEKNEKALAVFRASKGEDNLEVIALQKKLESDRINAELSGIKAVSKAGQSLFDEKTAASKAFAALNKIITVAEIALSFQKMAVKTTETGVVVANNTAQQGSNALTAITAAFSAPFPVGFAAGAAMIAIMASLLGGVFGGGSFTDPTESRQEIQGTGSLLGSEDKSESILKSQERFEDIQIDQLSELRGIRTSLGDVASGIALVTRNLVAAGGFGEFSGDLSGSNFSDSSAGSALSGGLKIASLGLSSLGGLGDKLISSLFGSTKKKVTDSGIQFIASSLSSILEDGIIEAQQFFDITKTKKKLFGLSKKVTTSTQLEDLDSGFGEEIGSIFKSIGDAVSQSASLLGFDVEKALGDFQVDLGKISLEGLSGEEIEAELQAVFSKQADLIAVAAVPSLSEFQKVGEGLFDTLTRVTKEQVIFNDNIDKLGVNLSELSSTMKIEVAQSVINLIGGLENFADLTNSFVDEFFTDAEKFASLEKSVSEVFDSLGLSMVTSRSQFRDLVEGVDLTTESGQELFAALLELNPALSEFIEGLEDAAKSAFSMLEKAIDLDKQKAKASLDVASEAHDKEISRINELRTALESSASSLKSLSLRLNESFGVGGDIDKALSLARTGDFSEAEKLNISDFVSLDASMFSSAGELAVQTALNQNKLLEIGSLADKELTETEKQLEKLELLEVSANDVFELHEQAYKDELERLDTIAAHNEKLLNVALGIDESVLSVADAIIAFNNTILSLSGNENIPLAPLSAISSTNNQSSIKQEEIKEEIKKTREDNVRFQLELIKNTKATANLLQRIEIDGLDTRSI